MIYVLHKFARANIFVVGIAHQPDQIPDEPEVVGWSKALPEGLAKLLIENGFDPNVHTLTRHTSINASVIKTALRFIKTGTVKGETHGEQGTDRG